MILISSAIVAGLLVFTLFLAFIWRRVVPTNMVHIVQSGKNTTSYGRGRVDGNSYYEIPSWVPFLGVTVTQFPESIFDISLREYEAYDIGRLPFVVDIKAFFRISDSQIAAQRVANFTELQNQLNGVLQGAVRGILGNNKLENIMQDRSNLGDQFTKEVNEQLEEWGVTTAKMIEFMDIRDSGGSQVIHNMMAKEKSRIEMESRVTVADNIREAEMKEIEAQREVALSRTQAEQQIGIRDAEREKVVGIAKEQSNQEVQAEAKLTAERIMEVKKVQEINRAEIDKQVAIVTAERERDVEVTRANGDKQSKVIAAEGTLQATKMEAEGVEKLGTAQAAAETAILLAPVNAQITLAKEIGDSEGYQQYLLSIKAAEVHEAIGKEMARAISAADIKIIANSGDINTGMNKVTDMFSSAGGTNIAAMLEAVSQTEAGKKILDSVNSKLTAGSTVQQ